MKLWYTAAAVTALMLAVGTAGAADAKKGKKVYNKCKACHALKAGKNKVGPSSMGSWDVKPRVCRSSYSKAMKNSGLTRDEGL